MIASLKLNSPVYTVSTTSGDTRLAVDGCTPGLGSCKGPCDTSQRYVGLEELSSGSEFLSFETAVLNCSRLESGVNESSLCTEFDPSILANEHFRSVVFDVIL